VREAITPNTIMIVGSAPSYAHGVVDPITEMAQVAAKHDLWFHVDACMGGFLLPYFKRLGENIPPFGFEVPGVWSLSMDLHKYAYCPKNASIILYKNKSLRRHQIYACSNWTGYTVVNNTIQSSKTGGPLAAAYAVVNFLGDEGYLELAKKKLDATKRIAAAIDGMEDVYLQGRPQMCLVCFASDTVNVFHVIDEMKLKGWYVQPQLAYGPSRKNIHLSINAGNHAQVDAMVDDLRECIKIAGKLPESDLARSAEEMFTSINPDEFDESMFESMLGMAGMTGVDLPVRMAEINDVLNALPFRLREKLLVEFLNQLYTPE
jgi:glutamate/tyrosine decarboxylase-like PLP-dependent enzyme